MAAKVLMGDLAQDKAELAKFKSKVGPMKRLAVFLVFLIQSYRTLRTVISDNLNIVIVPTSRYSTCIPQCSSTGQYSNGLDLSGSVLVQGLQINSVAGWYSSGLHDCCH